MKKVIVLLFVLVMTFSLAACGDDKEKDKAETKTEGMLENDTDGSPMFDFSKMSEEEKQKIAAKIKELGGDITFALDGTVTYVSPDGSVSVQKPDGSWSVKAEEVDAQIGGDWPKNNLTKVVTKPNMSIKEAYGDSKQYTVVFDNATMEDIKEYVEKLKKAGFDRDSNTMDTVISDYTIYKYVAKNEAGYRVDVVYSTGESYIIIRAE